MDRPGVHGGRTGNADPNGDDYWVQGEHNLSPVGAVVIGLSLVAVVLGAFFIGVVIFFGLIYGW
jgi:hypothetical protein